MKSRRPRWARWLIREFGGTRLGARAFTLFSAPAHPRAWFITCIYIAANDTCKAATEQLTTGRIWKRVLDRLANVHGTASDLLQMAGLLFYLLGIRKSRPAAGRINSRGESSNTSGFSGAPSSWAAPARSCGSMP